MKWLSDNTDLLITLLIAVLSVTLVYGLMAMFMIELYTGILEIINGHLQALKEARHV